MVETAMSQPPTPPVQPQEVEKLSRSALDSIRIIMPIVLIGLAMVMCSLFFLLWPAAPASHTADTSIHAARIFEQAQDEGGTGLIRSLVDVSIYVVVLAGIVFLIMAVMGRRGAVLGLIGVGLLGLIYAGGMALYNGPMVSVCGFTMILFGSLVAWIASGAADVEAPPSETPPSEASFTPTDIPDKQVEVSPPNVIEQRDEPERPDTPNWVS